MNVEKIQVGNLETNCYIFSNLSNEVMIIDPGDDFYKIKKIVNNRKVINILVTHEHYDHIGALEECVNEYDCDVNNFTIKNFDFEVLETPGHRFDSKVFYFKKDNLMFTGDFLFKGTFGRIDFPGSNKEHMLKSLIKIKKYPENIILYPGHGDETKLDYKEIDTYINYFM